MGYTQRGITCPMIFYGPSFVERRKMDAIISLTHSVSCIVKKPNQVNRQIYLAEGHNCPVEPLLK